MEEKILKQRGGKRDGAGRKKSLPEGTRVRTLALTDAEMDSVRKHVIALRKEEQRKREQVGEPVFTAKDIQDSAFGIAVKTIKAVAGAMIALNGGAPYEGVEALIKDAAMIGFKDAVSEYERTRKTK